MSNPIHPALKLVPALAVARERAHHGVPSPPVWRGRRPPNPDPPPEGQRPLGSTGVHATN
jgi:hypothetical protein